MVVNYPLAYVVREHRNFTSSADINGIRFVFFLLISIRVWKSTVSIMKVDGLNFFPVRSVILVRLDGVRKVVPSSGSLALALRIEGDSRSKLNKISATQLPPADQPGV